LDTVGSREDSGQGHFRHANIEVEEEWLNIFSSSVSLYIQY
jgi:hypothetical protein